MRAFISRLYPMIKAHPKRFLGYAVVLLALILLGVILYIYNSRPQERIVPQAEDYTLPDTLRVITLSGATTYFEYKGEEMGYQYDLMSLYAESRSLPYKVEAVSSLKEIHTALEKGTHHLSITPEVVNTPRIPSALLYTGPEDKRGLVLVQRARNRSSNRNTAYLKDVTQLLGKQIYALRGSREERRLHRLEEQLGGKIDIVSISRDSISIEELINMVSDQLIDYLCCDSELAGIAATYHKNLDVETVLGFPQRLRWLASPSQRGLSADLDRWSVGIQGKKAFNHVHRKYFSKKEIPSIGHAITDEQLENLPKGMLSHYDDIFRAEAARTPWSWPLLAAIAYQESRFDASVIGWSGARGLMGIMPRTGRIFGAEKDELLDPKVSVRVSVDCLMSVYALYSNVSDEEQRLKLALASYNAGQGHVQDAQRLAKKYGADPQRWDDNVSEYILLKSTSKYYQDPVCKNGYLRGKETYNYVEEVFARYQRYLNKIEQ